MGLSQFEQEDWEESLTSYSKAINIEQASVNELGLSKEYLSLFLNNRGLAYYHLKNFTDAIKDFDDAIEAVDGTNSENFFNRGNVYLNMEEYPKAHSDFDRAISLNKNEAKLRHGKGLAFQSEAEKLARSEPRDLNLEDLLVSKAIECFGDALICDNDFLAAKFHQGLMFRRTGNFNEAIR